MGLIELFGCVVIVSGILFLLGIVNVGDLMCGFDLGFDWFKFFLVIVLGGLFVLKVFVVLFGKVCFCLIGGIIEVMVF